MADRNQWGEIFNLTEELKRIEEEVDKRLEETLSEDPHVIEQETVHYGVAEAAADRAETFRMRQSVPLFGDVGLQPVVQPMVEPGAQPEEPIAESDMELPVEDAREPRDEEPVDAQDQAGAIWNEAPVEDYVAPRAAASEDLAEALWNDAVAREAEAYEAAEAEPEQPLAAQEAETQDSEAAWVPEQETVPVPEMVPDETPRVGAGQMGERRLPHVPLFGVEEPMQEEPAEAVVDAPVEASSAMTDDDAGEAAPEEQMVAEETTAPAGESAQIETPEQSKEPETTAAEETAARKHVVRQPAAENAEPTGSRERGKAKTKQAKTSGPDRTAEQGTTKERQPLIKDRRITLIILVAIIVLLAALLYRWYYNDRILPRQQYTAAMALYENGEYDEAIAAFTAIRNYSDAADKITETEYAKADALVTAGSYKEAIDYIDNLSSPTDAMQQLRKSAIYQLAVQYYEAGELSNAEGELLLIQDYEVDGVAAADLLHEIQYQEAADALAVYDFDTAEPILAALGDYEDAAILLEQVQNAIDVVYTDIALDDNGEEIEGQAQYLWVHSVITPGAISADTTKEEQTAALRELACATENVSDEAVHVIMMHMDTTVADMTYTDADPIETDSSTIYTKEITSYAAIDETFGLNQTVFGPQTLQRSDTDYALMFEGSETYAAKDSKDKEVRMECKMAEDGYWVKTRRVYAQMKDDTLIGVPKSQLRTWTKVLKQSLADEVRERFLEAMSDTADESQQEGTSS